MVEFYYRGRKYDDKDIIIWILIAISLFAISYAHSLENQYEDMDYELQLCNQKAVEQRYEGIIQTPIWSKPLIGFNISELNGVS